MANKPQSGIRLDPADPEYVPLLSAAGRVAALLAIAEAKNDLNLQYTLDLCLGAIYAVAIAKHGGYEHRTGPAEPDKPSVRAHDMETGWLRTDGKWMAGFSFNSGILRIAAVYHRSLKIAIDSPTTDAQIGALRPLAQERYPEWTDGNAYDVVRREANTVKHESSGLLERNATPDHATNAIGEILSLLEAWAAAHP